VSSIFFFEKKKTKKKTKERKRQQLGWFVHSWWFGHPILLGVVRTTPRPETAYRTIDDESPRKSSSFRTGWFWLCGSMKLVRIDESAKLVLA
jgi:hypothetical protein